MTSFASVVKVQFLGARSWQWGCDGSCSSFSAVAAPWCLPPATEPSQLGWDMNAYKYQKFLEGLNNLRGMPRLPAPCLLSLLVVWTLIVVCVVWGLHSPSIALGGLENPLTQSWPYLFSVFRQLDRGIEFVNAIVGDQRESSQLLQPQPALLLEWIMKYCPSSRARLCLRHSLAGLVEGSCQGPSGLT